MSIVIDEVNFEMWFLAKGNGRTKPSYDDFLDAVERHLPGATVQLQIQPNRKLLLRIKEKTSPALTLRVEGNALVTETATKPSVHTTGYRQLMEGMDA